MWGFAESRSSERRNRWGGSRPVPADEDPDLDADAWRRCHCPVCGHQDRVTVRDRQATIHCSHCETLLEVTLDTPTSESVSVRVALELPES